MKVYRDLKTQLLRGVTECNYRCTVKNDYQKEILIELAKKSYFELVNIFEALSTYKDVDLSHPYFINVAIHELDYRLEKYIGYEYGDKLKKKRTDSNYDEEKLKLDIIYYNTLVKLKYKFINYLFNDISEYSIDFKSDCKSFKKIYEKKQLIEMSNLFSELR